MPSYPQEHFVLREDEILLFQSLETLMREKLQDLAAHHIYSLQQLQRGNATMAAFESWCGDSSGYGTGQHRQLDELSRRLRMAVNKARNRARRVLSKRIRKRPTLPKSPRLPVS